MRDPSLLEAKVRLGHVLAVRSRPDDALAELTAVRDSQATPRLVYLAALFAGRVFQEARRLSEAEASYRVAAPLYPGCQVALTALSHVAFLSGNRDRASGLALKAVDVGRPDECEDPYGLDNTSWLGAADVLQAVGCGDLASRLALDPGQAQGPTGRRHRAARLLRAGILTVAEPSCRWRGRFLAGAARVRRHSRRLALARAHKSIEHAPRGLRNPSWADTDERESL